MNAQRLAQVPAASTENFFRYVGDLALKTPPLVMPTPEEIQEKFPWIRSTESDKSPTEPSILRLGTVLREDEEYPIKGDEYRRRVTAIPYTFLGYQHADLLVRDQDKFPEFGEIFKEEYDDSVVYAHPYVDFLGLIVLDKDSRRFCPRISVNDKKRLCLGWTWLDRGLRPSGRIAVARLL